MSRAPAPPLTDLVPIRAALSLLGTMPPQDALGVCAAYFFEAVQHQPDLLRVILNEKVVRHGFLGVSLLSELTRVAR